MNTIMTKRPISSIK